MCLTPPPPPKPLLYNSGTSGIPGALRCDNVYVKASDESAGDGEWGK